MARPELGTIERVNPRCIWHLEDRNFTPWLSDHLSLLGEALGMELHYVHKEASTGTFSLDILAHDGSGAYVAIENQLEWSDNSHLGQVLTYASHFDARTLIWVAPKFNDVHRSAIEWLNKQTAGAIKIYAVEVSTIRIERSPIAVSFSPVVVP